MLLKSKLTKGIVTFMTAAMVCTGVAPVTYAHCFDHGSSHHSGTYCSYHHKKHSKKSNCSKY